MQFRYDINGLRAIAVLAVVLFHFNPHWLTGGFAGVDVFFVISGFLMTSIIFNGIEKDTFNLFKFYTARANRIIPVLAVMSVVVLVFGWFYLLPTDYKALGKQVEKSLIFTSNILFSEGGGYFDTNEKTKWLLHTWSLSVEWQFYIFFPIILLIFKKYLSWINLKRVVLGLFLLSFIYCIYATYKDSKTAYFLLTSRAWEMLCGGLAFLYPISIQKTKFRIATQVVGLSLIVASYFLISENMAWPGYLALFPVLGAYLIILSNYQNNILINNPIFRYVGQWSYSIYVWHWPIVVLSVYLSFSNWWIYGIPLSILLGFLSYQFIEKRKLPTFNSWKEILKVKPFYMFLIIVCCGYVVKKTDGMDFHYSKEILNTLAEVENSNPYKCDSGLRAREFEECKIGNQNNVKAIIIGDSHADSLTTAVAATLDLKQQGVVSIATSSCPFLLNIKFYDSKNNCSAINQKRFALIKSRKYQDVPIILISRLPSYIEGQNDPDRIGLEGTEPAIYFGNKQKMSRDEVYALVSKDMTETLCQISALNPIYVMQPIPEFPLNVPKTVAKNQLLGINTPISYSYESYLKRSNKIRHIIKNSAQKCGAKVLDPAKILCKTGQCLSEYKGRPIYRDGDHMSEYGNKLLSPMFKEVLKD